MMKEDDLKLLRGFADRRTDIHDYRVAFMTANRSILLTQTLFLSLIEFSYRKSNSFDITLIDNALFWPSV